MNCVEVRNDIDIVIFKKIALGSETALERRHYLTPQAYFSTSKQKSDLIND